MKEILNYYSEHGKMTEIKTLKHMVNELPKDIESIVWIVQNILIHQHWAERYGVEQNEKRKEETLLRSVDEKLIYIQELGYKHVTDKKEAKHKMFGICRDFSVMAVSLCREIGIPARARCGFATYFEKGKYVDHWVLEYWNEQEKRWILVDAQLDDFQKEKMEISFDSLDINEKYFITGPRAWRMCRKGEVDPELFGIFQWWGYDYLKCNLILDANSLLKIPMQPWDCWEGYKSIPVADWNEKDYRTMDQLSEHILNVDENFEALFKFVQQNDKIKAPSNLDKLAIF